jgi:hypothetical protein
LGPNLTPVTPETFAIWKKTRMDKKEAETEALRKAKEAQHSAGKNAGMSGRDLVRVVHLCSVRVHNHPCPHDSSNTIPSGSKMKMKAMGQMIGILQSIERKRKKRISPPRRAGLLHWFYMKVIQEGAPKLGFWSSISYSMGYHVWLANASQPLYYH